MSRGWLRATWMGVPWLQILALPFFFWFFKSGIYGALLRTIVIYGAPTLLVLTALRASATTRRRVHAS